MGVRTLAQLREIAPASKRNLSDEELIVDFALQSGHDPQEVAEYMGVSTGRDSGAFGAGFGMGVDQAQSMVAGAGAALADVVGATGVRDALEAEARQQQAQSYLARNPEVAQRVEDIQGLGDVPGYVAGQLGQQVPIVGGILGASALGTLAGGPVGGVAAGLGTSYTYGAGSLYNEALEGGNRRTAEALLTAVPYALAEAAVPFGIGRVARGAGVPGVSSIASRRGRVAAAGGAGAVTEAATELFQTSLEIGMRDDLSPEEIYSRYLNAAVSGGLVGGGFSAAGATFGRAPQPETDPDADVTDTDVDTGPVDTTPENNVVPDAEGGVNLAGSQTEVDANRVAQEQDAELRELNKAEWRESLLPLTGRKLTRGDRRKLEGRKENLEYDLGVAEEVAPLATAGKGKSKRRRKKELVAERRSELQQELNNINTQLAADSVSRMAEADLTGLDNDVTPVERAIAEAERRAQAEAEAAQRVQGDVSPEVAPETLEEGIDLAQQVAPAAGPETEVAPEPAVEPVQAVSPVAETDLQVAQPATEPTPEAISPVVEEELVTAEDIEAEVQKDQDIARTLAAEVESDNVKVAGPITLEQPVIAAIARHLRSPKASGLNVVYEPGTANPVEVAPEISAQIDGVRQAVFAVAQAKASYDNVASNILDKDTDADIVGKEDTATAVAEANYGKRETARQNLVTAVENFIAVAGGRPNANAIIAAFKTTKEKRGKSRDLNSAESEFLSGVMPTKQGRAYKKLYGFHQQIDIGLSSAFRAYTNGELTASPDFAPRSAPVRQNKQQRKAEEKAGIRLFERDLQAAVEGGALGNSARTKTAPATERKIDDAVKSEKARLKEQRDNKTLTVPQYRKAVKDAEARGQAAKDAEQAKIDARLAETQGFEALINRALDTGVANVTERLIAKLARRAIKARRDAGIPDPVIEFGDESSFDPNKTAGGTITLKRESSPEVVAHEALHALLQGFVYANRSTRVPGHDPEVVKTVDLLRGYVKTLVNLNMDKLNDPLTPAQKAKASEAISVLRDLVNRGDANGEVDAVLELISYGNTLRDMKMLLTRVERRRTEKTADWRTTLRGIFEVIRRLLNKLTGASDTAANDVIDATVALLEGVTAKPVAPKKGKKLMVGKPAEQVDVRKYGTQGTYGLTKPVFDLLGKAFPGVPAKLKKLAEGVRKAIIEAFPGAEKILRKFNPQMAFGETLKKVFQTFKNEKHTGIQLAELVSNHLSDLIQRDIATAQKFIDYLDGNKAALNGVPDAELLKTRADNLLETIEEFKTALPETYKQFFDGRKFSESLIFVEEETDIGSGSVGQRKLSKIFGGRKQDLEKSDNPEWLGLKKEGDVFDSGAVYYRVMGETEGRPDPTKTIGFVREDQASTAGGITIDNDKGESFPIDMNAKWSGKDLPGKRFTFTTNKSVAEALKDANKMQAADQISAAILNTANTLGTYYASKKFLSGLANVGRDANGNIDPAAFERGEVPVVFKDVAEYNRYLEMTAAEGETVRPYDKKVQTANAAELKTGAVADEFRRQGTLIEIPDTTAMKSQDIPIKVWGDLAGKIVSGPVYAAIQDMSSKHTMFDKGAMRTYNDALRQFKLSKTTRNPGTHITNVASNVTIMMMHGITFKTAKEAASILYRASRNPGALTKDQLLLLKEFEKSGALLGNFSASEVKKTKYREMRDKIKPDNDNRGVMGRVSELLRLESDNAKAMGNYLLEKDRNLLELYAAEDNVFRLAAFMNRAGELQSANDGAALTADQWKQAGDFGREAFLNYDIDAKYLQYARQTIMPFASWTYAAIPMLGKIAVTRPWMIANVLTSYALLDAAMSALAGEDEEDRNRLGKMYNEKLFFNTGPNSMIRIPFMGDDENPVYFRLGDYIPLASTMRGTPAGFMGFENWPGGFSPNGPLVTLAGMFMNTDTYTGKKISDPTDSALDVTLNNLGMMVDMALPPVISTRNVGKAVDFIEGGTTISGRDISPMLFARAAGLKFYNPNVTEETMYKRIAERQIIRDYGIAISRAKREELRSGAPDYDALYAEIDSLRQEMREEIDKLNNRD